MDKRCRICTSKFGIFRKEVECERCHIACCKDCRSYTVLDSKQHLSVCKKCHTAVTTGDTKPRPASPPMNFKREMESKAANGSIQKRHPHLPKQNATVDMSDEDLKLAERFHKLIGESSESKVTVAELEARLKKLTADERTATQEEIEYRLAKLKGNRPPAVRVHSIRKSQSDQAPSTSSTTDTPERQVKKLIRQYTDEVAMETNYDPSSYTDETFDPSQIPEDITADSMILIAQEELKRQKKLEEEGTGMDENMEERLKKLQGMSPQIDLCAPIPQPRVNLDDLSDDEEIELIKRLTAEAGLEVSLANTLGGSITQHGTTRSGLKTSDESDQLPWCIICNEDASLRCHGCEGDLYCHRCYKEGHDKFDLADHKTSAFSAPKNMEYD